MGTENNFNRAILAVIILIVLVGVFGWMVCYFYNVSMQKFSISKIKSIHAELIQASRLSALVHNEDMGVFKTDMPVNLFAEKYFTPYLNINSYCKGSQDNCWKTPQYVDLHGTPYFNKSMYTVVLTDGVVIGFNKDKNNLVNLIVDVNGKVKPNKLGHDVFIFSVYNAETPPGICKKSEYNKSALYSGIHFGGLDKCGVPHDAYGYSELTDATFEDGCSNKSPASVSGFGAGSACLAVLKHNSWNIDKNYPW